MLALTAQCRLEILDAYTHQILDQVALMRPLVGWGGLLDAEEPAQSIDDALQALSVGRPAPVHLDVPGDCWQLPVRPASTPAPDASCMPSEGCLAEAAHALSLAKRPVMAVGLGDLSDAAAVALRALAEAVGVPVMTTYRAKGMVDEASPWSLGAFGLSPVVDAHQQAVLAEADLLVAVGLDPVEPRPQWLPGWPEDLPMMVVDRYGQPDIQHPARWDLRGDVPQILNRLKRDVGPSASTWTHVEVAKHSAVCLAPFDDGPHGPAAAIRAVQRGAGPQAMLSLDVGSHRITASHAWSCAEPRRVLQSNGFSSMGTGLPGAIAAKLCFPERVSVALTGDAGLWMSLGELGVVQDRQMDLIVVYLADEALSLIQLKQERLALKDQGVRFTNPDVQSLANAFGGTGRSVRGEESVEAVVDQAAAEGGLWLIEVGIDAAAYRRQM